ncbi:amine oxidase [Hyaloraphidium curvatum]|nr:amine oxidase [Hyaloraphidium curvatum]
MAPRTDCDVLVVGAGAAGIAAARSIAAAGRTCVVLEARERVGGRAHTDSRWGCPMDFGATWLHDAEHNAVVAEALAAGVKLVDSDVLRRRVAVVGDRRATDAEVKDYRQAWDSFEEAVEKAAAGLPPDSAVPALAAAPSEGPWDATVASFQGDVIAAWPLDEIDLADFNATLLEGRNLLPECGMGTLLERLAEGLEIRLGSPVSKLSWGPDGVEASGTWGTLAAEAAICTVPTAVLASGSIAFSPPLPEPVLRAAADLHLGAVVKVFLRAAGADRLGLKSNTSVFRQIAPGETVVPINLWPLGRDYATVWFGGRLAVELEAAGAEAAEARARREIARCLGPDSLAAFAPGAVVTSWISDPYALGAYSHAKIGAGRAREKLAAGLPGGRLLIAGEACHPTLAATVGGAWRTGVDAAEAALRVVEAGEGAA